MMVVWMGQWDGEGTLLFALLRLVVPSSVVYSEMPNPSSITEFLTEITPWLISVSDCTSTNHIFSCCVCVLWQYKQPNVGIIQQTARCTFNRKHTVLFG